MKHLLRSWSLIAVVTAIVLVPARADINTNYPYPSYIYKTETDIHNAHPNEGGFFDGDCKYTGGGQYNVMQLDTCYVYYAKTNPQRTLSATITIPKVNAPYNGHPVTQSFVDDVTTHEYNHYEVFQAFIDTVEKPFDAFTSNYQSNEFQTGPAAIANGNQDIKNARMESENFLIKYRTDRLLGHAGSGIKPASNAADSPLVQTNPNWNAQALAAVQAYQPKFAKVPGNCN